MNDWKRMIAAAAVCAAVGCDGGAARNGEPGTDAGGAGAHDGSAACSDCSDGGIAGDGGRGGTGGSCSLVDLIFAVDASSSMSEELKAMREQVFPAFAARLARVGKGLENFRVATIDACPNPATYHTRGRAEECRFSSGEPWIDSSSPDMQGEFACVGDIFQKDVECTGDNDDEQPASAAAASLEPPYATGPNLGFSRRDALLVIVAITDEDEQPTGNARSAQQVYERIVATKGDVQRVVFIGIGGGSECEGVYGTAQTSTKLKNITDRFAAEDRGVWHDLCVGKLEDSLDDAFEVIDRACNELPVVL